MHPSHDLPLTLPFHAEGGGSTRGKRVSPLGGRPTTHEDIATMRWNEAKGTFLPGSYVGRGLGLSPGEA
jgi:hypothetical protein